jgi:hypothetical protein
METLPDVRFRYLASPKIWSDRIREGRTAKNLTMVAEGRDGEVADMSSAGTFRVCEAGGPPLQVFAVRPSRIRSDQTLFRRRIHVMNVRLTRCAP